LHRVSDRGLASCSTKLTLICSGMNLVVVSWQRVVDILLLVKEYTCVCEGGGGGQAGICRVFSACGAVLCPRQRAERQMPLFVAAASAALVPCSGAEQLKVKLSQLGLKCGGTVQQRAERLYAIKGRR
jgi:hypothetical protein